jgi:hypothetical protein
MEIGIGDHMWPIGQLIDACAGASAADPWRQGLTACRIVMSAGGATDHEIVHLSILGMQQDRRAIPTAIIDGMVTRNEYWRGIQCTQ